MKARVTRFDGDTLFSTDNSILLKNYRKELTILCNEHTTSKEKVTEKTLAKSNKNGFKNNVGTVTNRATSMYDVLAGLEKGSEEYNILKKRIASSQLLQQAVIDSAKSGIVSIKMPKNWYNRKECKTELDKLLCCDKKPYFFIYVYKKVKTDYKNWLETWNIQCMRQFNNNTINDLLEKVDRTEEEQEFLNKAYDFKPITDNKCLMNNIAHYIERQFDGYVYNLVEEKEFDYEHFKYPNVDTTINLKNKILKMIKDYNTKEHNKIIDLIYDKDFEQQFETNCSSIELFKNELLRYDKKKVINCLVDIIKEDKKQKNILWECFGEDIIDIIIEKGNSNE